MLHLVGRIPQIRLRLWEFSCIRDEGYRSKWMLSFPNQGTIFTKWEQLFMVCILFTYDVKEVDADVDVVVAAVKNCL